MFGRSFSLPEWHQYVKFKEISIRLADAMADRLADLPADLPADVGASASGAHGRA
jgi:hypothetical protein